MQEHFDRNRCIDNIYFLAKKNNLTLGKLEEMVGVSQGYLSRLKVTSVINVELLIKIANVFNVSLEDLIWINFASLTETDEYILRFLEKLSKDTDNDSLVWTLEAEEDLLNLDINYASENDAYVSHPLFKVVSENTGVDASGYPAYSYKAIYNRGKGLDFSINGNCFFVDIASEARVYLMSVINNSTGVTGYDVYINKRNDASELLCSTVDSPDSYFSDAIMCLYVKVKRSMGRNHIKPLIKNLIDDYMGTPDKGQKKTKVSVKFVD